jgi:hypothetical protein
MRWDAVGLVGKLLIALVVFEPGEIWIFFRLEVVETEPFLSQGQHLGKARSSSWEALDEERGKGQERR